MLPLEALCAVHTIITHADCPDGVASALICLAAFPDAEVHFVQYGSAAHRDLVAASGMLFVDMTPPAERTQEFVDAGAICLDHHKKQEAIVRAFGERGVFADEKVDPGVSGAVLAHREVYEALCGLPHELLRLVAARNDARVLAGVVGIRDTWQRAHPQFGEASAVSEALRFIPFETIRRLSLTEVLDRALLLGPVLVERKLLAAREVAAQAVRLRVADRRLAIIPSTTLTSDAVEHADCDVLAGFAYVADEGGANLRLAWSLRSRAGVDVSRIAARHGGGGHTAAAGFHVPDDGRSPYVRAVELLAVEA